MRDCEKKILVLGAKGNLGSCLVEAFSGNGKYEVYSWTRKECDVTNLIDLRKKLVLLKPDVVINTVAYNAVDLCEYELSEQEKAILLNITLVEVLANVCSDIGAKLIQFSTNYVFDGTKDYYKEDDEVKPINFYGLTKVYTEKIVQYYMKIGLSACIIRVSNLFGPKGLSPSSKPSFFEHILNSVGNKEFLEVVNDEFFCFTYTRDIAEKLLDMLDGKEFEGIYHFVNSTSISWYEAAVIFCKLQELPIEIKPVESESLERKARRPKNATLISTRTTPLRNFKEAMEEYICDYLK